MSTRFESYCGAQSRAGGAYPGRIQINLERSAHMAGVAESFIQTE